MALTGDRLRHPAVVAPSAPGLPTGRAIRETSHACGPLALYPPLIFRSMNIDVTAKKSDGLQRLLSVSVPADEVHTAEERAARRYASQVRLPGFRPGKAPAAVVRRKFADAIRKEAIESVVQEAFKEIVDREKIDLATQPHVHDLKFDDGQPLTFDIHLEVRPKIELPEFQGRDFAPQLGPDSTEILSARNIHRPQSARFRLELRIGRS